MDARKWYNDKYIYPFSQRSFVLLLAIVVCALFLGLIINIRNLFPTTIQVKYSITADTSSNKSAQIIRANGIDNDPILSITDIMIKNYVNHRENYSYDNLKKQFVYIKNNSTRIVFRRFYNFMNIDNPSSPVMKYQKKANRNIKVISATYPSKTKAVIRFNAISRDRLGEVLENTNWLAEIDFEIAEINTNLPSGSRFDFTITDYQLKFLKDNMA